FREDLFHRLNVIRLRLPALRERREDVPMLTRHFLQQSARQLGVEAKRISDAALLRLEQFGFPGNVRQLENICHWLTVMAPAQVISTQDLPPEVLQTQALEVSVQPVAIVEPHVARVPLVPELLDATPAVLPLIDPPHETQPLSCVQPLSGIALQVVPWEEAVHAEVRQLLTSGQPDVWEVLTRRFESQLIRASLAATQGRRMEAAQRLGIGRNTITRKIQELGLDAPDTHERG
ncbi:MAG: nitrogen regulation protein NR(I), partial [Burkholderiaceae bacterium]|nr:nitrogen regulation protein NR(I) [Burkholderiaceae bacterium]